MPIFYFPYREINAFMYFIVLFKSWRFMPHQPTVFKQWKAFLEQKLFKHLTQHVNLNIHD